MLIRASIFTVLVVASIEVAGIINFTLVLGHEYADAESEKQRIYDLLPSLQVSADEHIGKMEAKFESFRLNRPHELHPYFAYVFESNTKTTNNFGFPSDVDYPYRAKPGEFVVGLFGGSAAQQLSEDPEIRGYLEQRILQLVKSHGYRSVRILAFCLSGWKQPVTHFAFSYYFQHLDMSIFLDGANETNHGHKLPSHKLYQRLTAQHLDPDAQLAIGEIAYTSKLLDRWTRFCSKPILRKSMFVHSMWRIGANYGMSKINDLRAKIDQSDPTKSYQGHVPGSRDESRHRNKEYFDFIEQASRWQAIVSRDAGKPYYHFLQPTKLITGTKPLSNSEEEKLKSQANYRRKMAWWIKRYKQLESMLGRMREDGFQAHSTTNIFKDTHETIYYDNVHLNPKGRRMLAETMAEVIENSFASQYGNN
jgi:hypothetical protein